MLAVFGKPKQEVLNSPLSPSKRKLNETPEDETFVASLLDNLYSSLPRRQRALVNEETWGGAGLGYVESERHQFATDGDVSVFFAGELVNSPSDLEDADFLLAEYKRTWDHASLLDSSPVMEALAQLEVGYYQLVGRLVTHESSPMMEAQLEGPFAFVIYDRTYGRIIAARDGQGAEPLVWGTTMLSDGLLFASDRSLIEGECADVDDFPAGTIFVSNDWSTAGNLSPIRPDGSEPVTKELCRVESRSNIKGSLTKVASGTDIQAN
ncbi:hypothetical protein N2152v2_003253 [Parachlorella kessleri]